jgi:general secretion pathway protein K
MKVETKLAQNANSEDELIWLGRSGVERARWVLACQKFIPNEPYDALNQVWAGGTGGYGTTNSPLEGVSLQQDYHLGNGSFSLKITDLERKFNINIADETILEQALRVVGANASDFTAIVNSILDWINPGNATRINGAESDYYQGLNPPYFAKNKPIDDLSELLLVKGVTPEIYWGFTATNHPPAAFQPRTDPFGRTSGQVSYSVGLVDLFTPISAARVNINTASAEVLQVIQGVDSDVAQAIVAARGGEDDGSGQAGPFRSVDPRYLWSRVPGLSVPAATQISRVCDVSSRTFEVQVDAQVAGYHRQFTAILVRNGREVQVLSFSWK